MNATKESAFPRCCFELDHAPLLGMGIGQAARQGPMARPTESSTRPSSFNKKVKHEAGQYPLRLGYVTGP
ncbi:hypothetical protein MTR_2g017900 [Medicago truncatula]|uniref:Uncharacterized protein n=1 Tax=Medicago truncatula TaxID=3880 RepID=G7ILT4_MEDTR|nr:hypothetical protein MTR_2g017900 [Medicago truncatula]